MSNTYYENNKEAIIERNKQYYRDNIDDKTKYNQEYYEKHKATIKTNRSTEITKERRKRTTTDRKEYQRQYYQNNKELCLANSFLSNCKHEEVIKLRRAEISKIKFECELCGGIYNKFTKAAHENTIKHLQKLNLD